MTVSPTDTYAFDVSGYFVVPGALTGDQVATFNDHLDALRPEAVSDIAERERMMIWLFNLHPDFAHLIDNSPVVSYLEAWVDDRLRIDQGYGLVHLPGEGAELHGGPDAVGTAWYRVQNNRVASGLTVASYALTDADSSTGGFRCVPGSHKGAFPVDEAGAEALAVDVPVSAGDATIFTEALVHGSAWRGPGSRRTLIVKYSPGTQGYLSVVWTDDDQSQLTDRQRRMVLPPFEFDVTTRTYRQRVTVIEDGDP